MRFYSLGWYRSGQMIPSYSEELMNLFPESIPWFLWCIMVQVIMIHIISQRRPRRNVPGGEGYSQKSWMEVCGLLSKTPTLFMFPIPFPFMKFAHCKCYHSHSHSQTSIPHIRKYTPPPPLPPPPPPGKYTEHNCDHVSELCYKLNDYIIVGILKNNLNLTSFRLFMIQIKPTSMTFSRL